jgi:hypothetical protein
MAKVLVVANRTAECEELQQALKERAEKGDDVKFTLVVPSAHGLAKAAGSDDAVHDAEGHINNAVKSLREAGLDVEGRIGDPDPVAAVADAANGESFDEVIVSTLPTHLSKWLHLDLPRKAAHATGLPVTHVVGSEVK